MTQPKLGWAVAITKEGEREEIFHRGMGIDALPAPLIFLRKSSAIHYATSIEPSLNPRVVRVSYTESKIVVEKVDD